jgi:heme A synthase
MSLTLIHDRLSLTALMYVIIIAIWGFWRFARRQQIDGSYWGGLAVAEILIIVQGLLGMIMWFSGLRPVQGWIHILYGVASALVIPGIFAFTRGGSDRRATMIYAVGALFLAGLIIRGIATGG